METTSLKEPRYAGFLPRAMALLIDGLITVPPCILIEKTIPLDQTGAILTAIVLGLFGVGYYILLLGFYGQTVGMRVAKVKVTRLDLSSLRWSNAFLRYSVDVFMMLVFLYIRIFSLAKAGPEVFNQSFLDILNVLSAQDGDYATFIQYSSIFFSIWPLSELAVLLMNKKRRAIHDFIGGTVVVIINDKKEIVTESEPINERSKFVIGLLILFAVLSVGGTILRIINTKERAAKLFTTPIELKTVGVRKGQGFVTSGTVLTEESVGEIKDIIADPVNSGTFWVAGKLGILELSSNGEVLKTSLFQEGQRGIELHWLQVGTWLGLLDTSVWTHHVSVMDTDGKNVWNYDTQSGIEDIAAGNFEGDSKPYFLVGTVGSNGMHLLNNAGQSVWEKDVQLRCAAAADLNGDGKDEIVLCGLLGKLGIYDKDGGLLREYKPSDIFSHFSVLSWPWENERFIALIPSDTHFTIYSLQNGRSLGKWEAGVNVTPGKTKGQWIEWNAGGARSLALLTDYHLAKASLLSLFDESGNLQYQEVIGKSCTAMTAVAGSTPGSHVLWCGYDNKIVSYSKAP